MSKLINKTFYVSNPYIEAIKKGEDSFLCPVKVGLNQVQIQISWTEPDREVTIKESKFGEIIGEYPLDTNEVSSLIEKLFGAEK